MLAAVYIKCFSFTKLLVFCIKMAGKAPINEQEGDRVPLQGPEPEAKETYAEDMRLLSAASLGFAVTFLTIFHNYMNHQFPNEQQKSPPSNSKTGCTSTNTEKLRIAYVVLGTAGFMWLFGTALVSYEISHLFRRRKPDNSQRVILHLSYFLVFIGMASSLSSHAIGIYLVHKSHIFISYVAPAAGIFVLMIVIVLGIQMYFKE